MYNLVICRHGETDWSLSGQHTGLTDIPLTSKGEEDARLLQDRLKHFSFDAVYSSPLARAKKTCILAGFENQMILEPLAKEWNYGNFEGLTSKEIAIKHPHWNLFLEGAPHGETPLDVKKRADILIEKFLKINGSLLLFSHGHFLRVLAARWIQLDIACGGRFSLSTASMSILGFEKGERVIQLWNSTTIRL